MLDDPSLPRAARLKVAEFYTWQARAKKILDAVEEKLKIES